MKKNLKITSLMLSAVIALSSAAGSVAAVSAEANTGSTPGILGDANSDGKVNVRDCAFIASKLAQGKAAELPAAADYNKDSSVNVRDAAALAKAIAAGGTSDSPEKPGAAAAVFRLGKWSGSDMDYYFTSSSSGRMTEKGSTEGTAFGYEINKDGSAVFHIGDTFNNTKASVAFTGDNAAVIQWDDGRTENLSYSDGSRTFKPGKWTSNTSDYYFYSETSGSRSAKNADTGISFEYTVDEDSSAVFHLGAADDDTAASVVFIGDENAVIKWANGMVEELRFVPSEINFFRKGKWTSGSVSYYFTGDHSGMTENADGLGSPFEYSIGRDGSAVFSMGAADNEKKAYVVFSDSYNAYISWEDGQTETVSYVPEENAAPFSMGIWNSNNGSVYYFTSDSAGHVVNELGSVINFTYNINTYGLASFYMIEVGSTLNAQISFIDNQTAIIDWEKNGSETITFSPVRQTAFKTGIWYGNNGYYHFSGKTEGYKINSDGTSEKFTYELKDDGTAVFHLTDDISAGVTFFSDTEASIAWEGEEMSELYYADYKAESFKTGAWSGSSRQFHFTDASSGHTENNDGMGSPFTYELSKDGSIVFHTGAADNSIKAKAAFIDENKAVMIRKNGSYEILERIESASSFKKGLWRGGSTDYYFDGYDAGHTIDKENGTGMPFAYEINEDGKAVFNMGAADNSKEAEIIFFGDAEAQVKWADGITELLRFESEEISAYEDHTISGKKTKIYSATTDDEYEYDLFFMDGVNDIPYISAESMADMLNTIAKEDIYTAEYINDGPITRISKNINGQTETYMQINFAENKLFFPDYNLFFAKPDGATIMDMLLIDQKTEDGRRRYFQRLNEKYQRHGEPLTIDLSKYDIFAVYKNGRGYIPLQTYSDMFLTQKEYSILYNGKIAVLRFSNMALSEKADKLYYSIKPKKRSSRLAEFSLNELCLALDNCYGLQENHGIKDFKKLFEQTELLPELLDTDPVKADEALARFINLHLDDLHSSFLGNSPYAGKNAEIEQVIGTGANDFVQQYIKYVQARYQYYPNGVPGYEKIGNTAYITFDNFAVNGNSPDFLEHLDHYNADKVISMDQNDTLTLLSYANEQIKNDPEIENVVLDLSCNTGGLFDTAISTSAWLLGTTTINLEDPITGALSTTTYAADINFDMEYDENDTVADKNIFCLTSPASFSCGNLVPALLSSSNNVTMIGRPSGGGSCAVQAMSTADGSSIAISSRLRLSYKKNGSYYDIDKGVQPDYTLSTADQFYDREALTEYINSDLLGKKSENTNTETNAVKLSYHYADKAEGIECLASNSEYYDKMCDDDVNYRLQKKVGKKGVSELKEYAREQILDFSDKEKKFMDECIAGIENTINKNGYNFSFPDDIVFIKSTMNEEGGAGGYTHKNQIYLGEEFIKECVENSSISTKRMMQQLVWHELFHIMTRNDIDFKRMIYDIIGATVADEEYTFPEELAAKRISNPDVDRYDSCVELTIDGKKRKCVVFLCIEKPFDKEGTSFFEAASCGIMPIDYDGTIYTPEQTEDFFEVFGQNTGYVIAIEETLADNFSFAMIGTNAEISSLPDPEIVLEIQNRLKN